LLSVYHKKMALMTSPTQNCQRFMYHLMGNDARRIVPFEKTQFFLRDGGL
jgi:hypothetical protein